MSPGAKAIMSSLLQRDPTQRLGANGGEEIKRHIFFKDVNWDTLIVKRVTPPFKPSVVRFLSYLLDDLILIQLKKKLSVRQESALDTANFDSEFTSEAALDSVVEDTPLGATVQDQFINFTYNPANEYL